jgi:cytochrome c oxidase subunit 2
MTFSTFDPQGPGAAHIASLWWLLLGLGVAVYLLVMGLFLWAFWRRRQAAPDEQRRAQRDARLIVGGGMIFPALILLVVFGATLTTLRALSAPTAGEELVIRVTGRQWWWEIHYPAQGITTANELYLPVGQAVKIELAARDVIHSFWAPQLHGKLDMIPGQVNHFWLQADRVGEFWGLCAEFCGLQHAKMAFLVVAQPPAEFAQWLAQQQQPAATPATAEAQRGQQIFVSANCAYCHPVRGLQDEADLGPDLTHLASRRTLAAATLPNNRGNLENWILRPQHLKPGNLMPATPLAAAELQDLLAYLSILQ